MKGVIYQIKLASEKTDKTIAIVSEFDSYRHRYTKASGTKGIEDGKS